MDKINILNGINDSICNSNVDEKFCDLNSVELCQYGQTIDNRNFDLCKQNLSQSVRATERSLQPEYVHQFDIQTTNTVGLYGKTVSNYSNNNFQQPNISDVKESLSYQLVDDGKIVKKVKKEPKADDTDYINKNMGVEYTRYTNPLALAPSCTLNRFESLYINHQEASRWKTPFLIGEQTRWSRR